MLFHRIVPSLLIQTGAIRSTSIHSPPAQLLDEKYRTAVQADEALERRQYELNARLRFNHRGQVAMALGVADDNGAELQPQFFITTADAPYLDEKHVLFGTLGSGSPTIFNAIRINGTAIDEGTNQPLELEHAPRVLSTKIVENEIHTDLVAQQNIPWRLVATEPDKKKKKKKRKGKLDVNVLSFGDEMGDVQQDIPNERLEKGSKDPKRSKLEVAPLDGTETHDPLGQSDTIATSKIIYAAPKRDEVSSKLEDPSKSASSAQELASVATAQNDEQQESLVELRRSKYAKRKKTKQEREEETIARLAAFQQKLGGVKSTAGTGTADKVDNSLAARMARREEEKRKEAENEQRESAVSYHGQILESDGEEDNTEWIGTRFKCRRHIDHSAGADGRNADEYEVIDDKKRSQKHDKHHKKRKQR